VLAALGFKALATTSSGFAFTLGRLDGRATLDEVVAHTAALDAATELPVSVDLENGYGPDPADAAHAIVRVAEAGAVGARSRTSTGRDVLRAGVRSERIAAAVESIGTLDFPFMLTARAENHIRGNPALDDTITRLQAYERAGRRTIRWASRASSGAISRVRGGRRGDLL
jgi:2-methylisocitrate lyase-like PEP mutase family enzyme